VVPVAETVNMFPLTDSSVPVIVNEETLIVTLVAVTLLLVLSQTPLTVTVSPVAKLAMLVEALPSL